MCTVEVYWGCMCPCLMMSDVMAWVSLSDDVRCVGVCVSSVCFVAVLECVLWLCWRVCFICVFCGRVGVCFICVLCGCVGVCTMSVCVHILPVCGWPHQQGPGPPPPNTDSNPFFAHSCCNLICVLYIEI